MASFHTIERSGRTDWTLMTAIHDALRRDLGELITTTVGPTAVVIGHCFPSSEA